MKYFRDSKEITKEQAFDCIKVTAKHMYNADYDDSKVSLLLGDHTFNSTGCIDPANGERFTIYTIHENYTIPELLVQGRLF